MSHLLFSREELDYQYSPSRWSKRLAADVIVDVHSSITLEATKVSREKLKCDLGIEYMAPGGPTLDIYYPSNTTGLLNDALYVYYHGGYWEALGVEYSGVAAIPITKNGATMVAVGYTLAPKVNMTTIVEQCMKSIVFIKERFPNKRIFLAGHSAGAHLVANLMITDWSQYGMEITPLSGSILLSGVYDLTPIKKMYCDNTLHLTQEEISKFSPMLRPNGLGHLPAGYHNLVAWGEWESPEYKRHSQEFAQILIDHGMKCTSIEVPGIDHFQLHEGLSDEDFILTQMIIKLMK